MKFEWFRMRLKQTMGVGRDIALLGEFFTKYHYTIKNALVELWGRYHTNFIKGYKPFDYTTT